MTTLPIDAIIIGERSRQDLRNIESLARSIRERGILQPPVVRKIGPSYHLVCGQRRIVAMQHLGWTETPVTVATTLDDEIAALYAEADENTEREPFTAAEAVAHARRIREAEARRAKERQRQGQERGRAVQRGEVVSENFSETKPVVEPPRERETRHRVARATGYSAPTLKKAERVLDVAADESQPEPVRKIAKQAAANLSQHGAKVDREFKAVEKAVMDNSDQADAYRDARWRQALSKELGKVIDLRTFDPERIVAICDDDLLFLIDRTCTGIAEWHAEITRLRKPGLRVVQGGGR